MVQTQFSLSWESYKSSICDGFSSLQQNGEMVDMTIAADGHFVKVHQVLMALASSYLKSLIISAPCPHPIVFLNNISHQTLRLILEYIYTGQVHVPADSLHTFMATAKALHINGLEKMTSNDFKVKNVESMSRVEETNSCTATSATKTSLPTTSKTSLPTTSKTSLPTTSDFKKVTLPLSARKVTLTSKDGMIAAQSTSSQSSIIKSEEPAHDDDMDYAPDSEDLPGNDSDDNYEPGPSGDHTTSSIATHTQDQPSVNFQFTVSIRGSLQVILNRYIYNLHSVQHTTGVRRWRCVNYRNSKCTAFVVTKGNIVLNRANMHNHSFHDKKILQKIQQKAVFSSLKDIESYQEKEGKKIAEDEIMVSED